ncbi:MAG: ABC transporter permease [Bacillota bacterium]
MSGAYFMRRLFQTAVLMFVVITLNFFLPRVMPGDPARHYYEDPRLSEEARQEIKALFGLDKPLSYQYFAYLKNLFRGELGVSYTYRRPVMQVISSRIPWTVALTASASLISIAGGIIYGAYAAWRRGGTAESALLASAIIVSAMPTFWFALLLVMLFAFTLKWLPAFGMVTPGLARGLNLPFLASVARHAFLPVVSMALSGIIGYAVLVRNSMIDVTSEDFVRTARAKGLNSRVVLYKHAFRNAMLPLVTRIGLSLSGIIGGAVIIETIFSWEGMGLLIIEASRSLDYPLMQGTMLILATITVLANFATDLVYAQLDPRVQLK